MWIVADPNNYMQIFWTHTQTHKWWNDPSIVHSNISWCCIYVAEVSKLLKMQFSIKTLFKVSCCALRVKANLDLVSPLTFKMKCIIYSIFSCFEQNKNTMECHQTDHPMVCLMYMHFSFATMHLCVGIQKIALKSYGYGFFWSDLFFSSVSWSGMLFVLFMVILFRLLYIFMGSITNRNKFLHKIL